MVHFVQDERGAKLDLVDKQVGKVIFLICAHQILAAVELVKHARAVNHGNHVVKHERRLGDFDFRVLDIIFVVVSIVRLRVVGRLTAVFSIFGLFAICKLVVKRFIREFALRPIAEIRNGVRNRHGFANAGRLDDDVVEVSRLG